MSRDLQGFLVGAMVGALSATCACLLSIALETRARRAPPPTRVTGVVAGAGPTP